MNFLDYINYSKDEEVICLSNKEGIQFFDTQNFELMFKLNRYRIGLSGDVYKAKIFYNTRIIGLNIIETLEPESKDDKILYNSSKIKRHSLIIYDMKNYEIIGKITMKNFVEINDFIITKYLVIITIDNKNKVLLFKTSNLEYYKTLSGIDTSYFSYIDDSSFKNLYKGKKPNNINTIEAQEKKCFLAYKDLKNKNNVCIITILFDVNNNITEFKTRTININMNTSELKYIGIIFTYLIVSSKLGNKLHLYDIFTGEFKYCLFLGNFPYEICGLKLDNKQKILSIVTNNKYLKLYKLKKLSKQCKCHSHNDEKVSMKEERGVFDKFKHKLGVGRNDFLCRFKVNINVFDMKYNNTAVFFDKQTNDCIYILQLNKSLIKLKFDRKKSKGMTQQQSLILPKYVINKNDLRSWSLISEEEKEHAKKIEEKKKQKDSDNNNIIDDDDLDELEEKNDEGDKDNQKKISEEIILDMDKKEEK